MGRFTFKVLVALVLFFPSILFADESIGALESRLQLSRIDTVKIELLLQMGDYFEHTNYESALHFYEQALTLSRQSLETPRSEQHERILKLLEIKSLRYIAILNEGWSLFEKALEQHKELTELYQKIDNQLGVVSSMISIGNNHYYLGNASLSLEFFREALEKAEKHQFLKQMADLRTNIANLFYFQGDYTSSLEFYHKAIPLYNQLKENRNIGIAYTGIGNIHSSLRNYEKAEEFYRLALRSFDELEDHRSIASTYLSLGALFFAQNKFDKAEEAYLQALRHATISNDLRQEAQSYLNLGVLLAAQGNSRKAIEYYDKALAAARQVQSKHTEAFILRNKAMSVMRIYDYRKALELAKQSLVLAQELGFLEDQAQSFRVLSQIREQQGDFRQALYDFQQFKLLNDSLLDSEKKKELNELDARFQAEQKQQKIDMQNLEIEKNKAEIKRKNQLVNTFIIVMVFVILLAIATVVHFNQRKITNMEILSQKEVINEKTDHIEILNEELEQQKVKYAKLELGKNIIDHKLLQQLRFARQVKKNLNDHFRSKSTVEKLKFYQAPAESNLNCRDLFSMYVVDDQYLFAIGSIKTDEYYKTLLNLSINCYLEKNLNREKLKNPELCFAELQKYLYKQLASMENDDEKASLRLAMLLINKKDFRVRFISEDMEILLAISRNPGSIFKPTHDYHEIQKPEPSGIINGTTHQVASITQVYNIKLKESDRIYLVPPDLRYTQIEENRKSLYAELISFIDGNQNMEFTLQSDYLEEKFVRAATKKNQKLPDDFVIRAIEL